MLAKIIRKLFKKRPPSPYFGAIQAYDDRDYVGGVCVPRASRTFWDSKITYDQRDIHPMSCTIHAAMGAMSDLTGHKFDIEERNEVLERAIKGGLDYNGWWVNKAVHLVHEYSKELGIYNGKYKRVAVGSTQFFNAMRSGYSMITGFGGDSRLMADMSDGLLDRPLSNNDFYHAITIVPAKDTTWTERAFYSQDGSYRRYYAQDYEMIRDSFDSVSPTLTVVPFNYLIPSFGSELFFKNAYYYIND